MIIKLINSKFDAILPIIYTNDSHNDFLPQFFMSIKIFPDDVRIAKTLMSWIILLRFSFSLW